MYKLTNQNLPHMQQPSLSDIYSLEHNVGLPAS